jgi:hypothetical protein
MIARALGYVVSMLTQLLKEPIYGMLTIKELPQINAGGAQAETMTGIGVEENGPVVKLLPENDVRVSYGFFTIFHGGISPLPACIRPKQGNSDREHTTDV